MEFTSEPLRQAAAQGITFIDPRIDYAFKLIFGTPGNEDLLLLLVRAILPDKHIVSVSLESQEQAGLRKDSRRGIIDVKCTTEAGEHLIIEMQIKPQNDFGDRMVFYSSFPISNLLHRGDDNYRLTPIYVIGITDFIIPDVKPNGNLINLYSIRNVRDNAIVLSKNINYITVELPKLTKTIAEAKEAGELVLYTIKNMGEMSEMPQEYVGSGLEKMFRLSNFANMTEAEQYEYLARFMYERDAKSSRRYAREVGFSEGKAEGIAEGKADDARKMLADGLDIAKISQYTGLSPEQIQAL